MTRAIANIVRHAWLIAGAASWALRLRSAAMIAFAFRRPPHTSTLWALPAFPMEARHGRAVVALESICIPPTRRAIRPDDTCPDCACGIAGNSQLAGRRLIWIGPLNLHKHYSSSFLSPGCRRLAFRTDYNYRGRACRCVLSIAFH